MNQIARGSFLGKIPLGLGGKVVKRLVHRRQV